MVLTYEKVDVSVREMSLLYPYTPYAFCLSRTPFFSRSSGRVTSGFNVVGGDVRLRCVTPTFLSVSGKGSVGVQGLFEVDRSRPVLSFR